MLLNFGPSTIHLVGLIPAETIAVFHDFPVSEMSLHQLPHVEKHLSCQGSLWTAMARTAVLGIWSIVLPTIAQTRLVVC